MSNNDMGIRKGDLWRSRLNGEGSVYHGTGIVVAVSSDVFNITSTNLTVVVLLKRNPTQETHVLIQANKETGLHVDSTAMCETITTVSKGMLIHKIGYINDELMAEVDKSILKHLGIKE